MMRSRADLLSIGVSSNPDTELGHLELSGVSGATIVFAAHHGSRSWVLLKRCLQCESGDVGAASAAGLVADTVEVGAGGSEADEQLLCDLRVCKTPSYLGD